MDSCNYTPLELIIATTDPNLYDEEKDAWKWSGPLYWAVECLNNEQSTVTGSTAPPLPASQYIELQKSPATWNYCLSKYCNNNSVSMLIVFTFKPQSTNPGDFLQFVIDIHGQATDIPTHSIEDAAGQSYYLDIIEVSKMTKIPYVEVWLAKSHQNQPFSPNHVLGDYMAQPAPITADESNWNVMLIVLLIVLFTALGVGGWLFFSRNKSTTVAHNIY